MNACRERQNDSLLDVLSTTSHTDVYKKRIIPSVGVEVADVVPSLGVEVADLVESEREGGRDRTDNA